MSTHDPFQTNEPDPLEKSLMPPESTCRTVLLDCICVMERLIHEYHRHLLRAAASSEGDEIRSLSEFADWATFALAHSKTLLLGGENHESPDYRYCPPNEKPCPDLVNRLLARRASRVHANPAERRRRRLH